MPLSKNFDAVSMSHRKTRSNLSATENKFLSSEIFEKVAARHRPTKSSLTAASCIDIAGAGTPQHSDHRSVSPHTGKQQDQQQHRQPQSQQQQVWNFPPRANSNHRTVATPDSNSLAQEEGLDFTLKKVSWTQFSARKQKDSEQHLLDPVVLLAVRRNARTTNLNEQVRPVRNILPVAKILERGGSQTKSPSLLDIRARKKMTASANLTPTKPRTRTQQEQSHKHLIESSIAEQTSRQPDSMSQRRYHGIWAQSAQGSKQRLESFHQTVMSARRSSSSKSKSQSVYPELHIEDSETAVMLRAKKAELLKLKKNLSQMSVEKNKLEKEMLELAHSKQAILFELEESREHNQELEQIIELRNSELNKLSSQLETMQRLLDHQTRERMSGRRQSQDKQKGIPSQSVQRVNSTASYDLDVPEYGIAIIEESCGEESDRSDNSPRRARAVFESSDFFNPGAKHGRVSNLVRRKLKEFFSTKKRPNISWVEELLDIVIQDPKLKPTNGSLLKGIHLSVSGFVSRPQSGDTTPHGGESAVAEFEDDFTEEDFSIYQKSKKLFAGGNPFTPSKPSTPRSNRNISESCPADQEPPLVPPVSQSELTTSLMSSLILVLLQILQHKYFENESLYGLTRWLQSQLRRYKLKIGDFKSRQRDTERILLNYQQVLLESNSGTVQTPIQQVFSSQASMNSFNSNPTYMQTSPPESTEATYRQSSSKNQSEMMNMDEEPVMGGNFVGEIEWRNDDTIIYQ